MTKTIARCFIAAITAVTWAGTKTLAVTTQVREPAVRAVVFLTSACVEYQGKPDDCEELTALRSFRDTYMKSTEDGNKLVDEYYVIAPKIVEKINASNKKELYVI